MLVLVVLFILAWLIVWGLVCRYVAGERGKDQNTWMFLGAVLGFIALLILMATPMKKKDRPQ